MTDAAIIQADFADFRQVKGRKVAQLIFEVPLEHLPKAMDALGWPQPGSSLPVAIARLNAGPAEASPTLVSPVQQPVKTQDKPARPMLRSNIAATWLHRPDVQRWMDALNYEGADMLLKAQVGISSKTELDTNEMAWEAFRNIQTSFAVGEPF